MSIEIKAMLLAIAVVVGTARGDFWFVAILSTKKGRSCECAAASKRGFCQAGHMSWREKRNKVTPV